MVSVQSIPEKLHIYVCECVTEAEIIILICWIFLKLKKKNTWELITNYFGYSVIQFSYSF